MGKIKLSKQTAAEFLRSAAKGGKTTLQRHGRSHFVEAGKKSAAQKDRAYYSMMGKKSAEARKRKKERALHHPSPMSSISKLLGGS